jgi:hypothetical protein
MTPLKAPELTRLLNIAGLAESTSLVTTIFMDGEVARAFNSWGLGFTTTLVIVRTLLAAYAPPLIDRTSASVAATLA